LGVYATDIGYLSSYGKTQEALNYMDVCLKLTETVGAKDAIDFNVLERFEKNLSNPDSLATIIDQVIDNSDKYLQNNERTNIAALVIGGTFIEALYISLK
jgi:protein associated with RNAse G/E